MANFTKLALTAKRLIEANGRPITVVKYGNASQDQDKPWRGRKEYREAEVTGYGAFVPRTQLLATTAANVDGVIREADYFLFSGADDGGYELEKFNAIIDSDGSEWKIASCELINPGSTRVLYQIEVTR